ncbi:hypothetical protein X777_09450 [Ooceraea biroi]|uniref:Uncharacterized protein n=1 Tax=Ooceraea biroi TaxID=2015173 RepID=A0A026W8M4_OOCBI|nr:hypothetical protein X777_09450 [Ooceraea biroi]
MEGKKKLKGSNIWTEEDFSWEERRERWVMRKIAMEEERKGNRVWRGNRKMRINEEWWWWDEEIGGLTNNKGEKKIGGGKRKNQNEEERKDNKMEEN